MKSISIKLALACALLLPFSASHGQIFPALTIFDGNTGVLKVPALIYQGGVYYLELSVADAASLTMKIEESTLVDVSPTEALSGNVADNIVGSWSVQGEEVQITFNADATWELTQAAGADEESCPEGGSESGTFRYTPSTGVFIPIFQVDENGHCGISSAGGVIRLIPDGNTMELLIGTEEASTLELN